MRTFSEHPESITDAVSVPERSRVITSADDSVVALAGNKIQSVESQRCHGHFPTNNTGRMQGLEGEGIEVREQLSLIVLSAPRHEHDLHTGQQTMGYLSNMMKRVVVQ